MLADQVIHETLPPEILLLLPLGRDLENSPMDHSGVKISFKGIARLDGTTVAKPLKRGQEKVQKSYCVF